MFASERSQVGKMLQFTSGQGVDADSVGQTSLFVGRPLGSLPLIIYRLWFCDQGLSPHYSFLVMGVMDRFVWCVQSVSIFPRRK